MNFSSSRISKNSLRLTGVFIVVICAGLVSLYTTRLIVFSNDSMSYALVSQQIVSGRGLRVPMTQLRGLEPDHKGTTPFIVHPPLLPLLLAAFGGVRPETLWPAQVLNILSHIVVAVFCGLIAEKLQDTSIGIVTGVCAAFAWPLLMVSHVLWSEPLFVVFVVTSLWCLQISRCAKRQWPVLCGAGFLAGAAIATRFAGMALLPLFVWEIFRVWKSRTQKPVIIFRVLALLIGLCTAVILLARNYILSGTIRGLDYPSPGRSMYAAVYGVIAGCINQFDVRGFVAKVIILLLFVFIPAVSFFLSGERKKTIIRVFRRGGDLLILFVAGYISLMSYAMVKYQPDFELRFFVPVAPFVLIATVLIIDIGWRNMAASRMRRVAQWGRVTSLTLIVVLIVFQFYWSSYIFSFPAIDNEQFLGCQTFNWMKEHLSAETLIATNEPSRAAFFGGYPVLMLSSREQNPNWCSPDDMLTKLPERMARVGANYLILFAGQDDLSGDYLKESIALLSENKRKSGPFRRVYNCGDGAVYRLSR